MSERKLADLIASARSDGPTPAEHASLTRRLGPLLGGPGGGGPAGDGGASGGAATGAAGKIALAIGGLGTIGAIVGIALSRTPAPAPTPPIASIATDAAPPADAAPVIPTDAAPAAAAPAPRRRDAADSLAAESTLLDGAQRALVANDAARALARCDDHLRRYPRGALREERERIAIEALVALGRRREAKARVIAFDRAFPGSVQSERVHALVDP